MTAEEFAVVFANNVRALLAARGWSQAALAAKLDVSQPAVARMLSGNRPPNGATLAAVATVFEVDPCELICRAKTKPPKS